MFKTMLVTAQPFAFRQGAFQIFLLGGRSCDRLPAKTGIMRYFVRFFFLASCLMACVYPVVAQQTAVYHDKELHYKNGMDLFDKQKYGAAQKEFESALKEADLPMATRDNCAFYAAWCAALLYHAEAEFLLQAYLDKHPVSPNRQ